MIHHVALEVRPEQMAVEGEFWLAVGFERVSAPEALGPGYDWYEGEGRQVHLMATDDPARPPSRGHTAVVASDVEAAVSRLRSGGFEVTEGRQLWGERRIKTVSPAGYVVEIMAAAPTTGDGPA